MGASNYVHLDVEEILRETPKAFLVRIDGEEHWLPFTQIADHENYEVGDCDVTLSVTEWIAEQKGLLQPTPQQQAFLDEVNEAGGMAVCVWSVDDLDSWLRDHGVRE